MSLTAGVPEKLKPLFWDVDWEKMDVVHHEGFIIERVLNMGDAFALRWAESVFSLEAILRVVKETRRLSPKTARCWQNYFGLREEEMRCFGTFSTCIDKYF